MCTRLAVAGDVLRAVALSSGQTRDDDVDLLELLETGEPEPNASGAELGAVVREVLRHDKVVSVAVLTAVVACG